MKRLENLRWVIIAPEAEVTKWTAAFKAKQPAIQLEVGPKVDQQESVDIILLFNTHTG